MINCDIEELEVDESTATQSEQNEQHDPGLKELEPVYQPAQESIDACVLESELSAIEELSNDDNFEDAANDFTHVHVKTEDNINEILADLPQNINNLSVNRSHKQLLGIKKELQSETIRRRKVSIQDFRINTVIGRGGYGKVMLVSKLNGSDRNETYAMKTISKAKLLKSKTDTQHTRSERKILEAISHPFIVQLKYAFQNSGKLYLVMEYLSGGELFRLLDTEGYLKEEWAIFYIAEITLALGHLHSHGVIYRDLKPENIMLDKSGHIKLTDFGLSKERLFDSDLTHTFCGTVDYMAPEVIARTGHNRAADWWSLGALTFDMLVGHPPFTVDNDRQATERNIMSGRITLPSRLTRESRSFIKVLLVRNTKERLGGGPKDAADVRDNQFFTRTNIDWLSVMSRQVSPPVVPRLQNTRDTSYFESQFTRQPAIDSPSASLSRSYGQHVHDAFLGFSYDPTSQDMSSMISQSPLDRNYASQVTSTSSGTFYQQTANQQPILYAKKSTSQSKFKEPVKSGSLQQQPSCSIQNSSKGSKSIKNLFK